MQFLVVHDEKMILVNRIAPMVPLVGAFIATLKWNYRLSLLYIGVGAAAKYAFLLALVAWLGVVYDPSTAKLLTVGAVVVVVILSAVGSVIYRRRLKSTQSRPG